MTDEKAQPSIKKDAHHSMFFTGFLKEDIAHFLRLSGNPDYTPSLTDSIHDVITTIGQYPKIETNGLFLTGSLARYWTGNGDPEVNWHIRKTAETAKRHLHDETNMNMMENVCAAEQDMDTNIHFTSGGSIQDLYDHFKHTFPHATETAKFEQEKDEQTPFERRFLTFVDMHGTNVTIEYGHVRTNRDIVHLKAIFSNEQQSLFHIDIAEFPKSGLQALDEGRTGGLTIDAQDLMIPITIDSMGDLICAHQANNGDAYSLLHKESMDINGKSKEKIIEFSMRALRIHLIHSKELFRDAAPQTMTPVFHQDDLFAIRKSVQAFVREGGTLSSQKQAQLYTELFVSLANNPYATAKFLQDTGIYMLIPGMRDMDHRDWKKLFTSNAFAFPKFGQPLLKQEFRTIENIQAAQEEFLKHPWENSNNGMLMFLRAFGEAIHERYPSIDPTNYDSLMDLLCTKKSMTQTSELQNMGSISQTLGTILKAFPSGLTEREIQQHFIAITNTNISREEFHKALFTLKTNGNIDKQIRRTDDGKSIRFYSPRLNQFGNFDRNTIPFINNNEIRTLCSTISIDGVDEKVIEELQSVLPYCSCTTIESFRPLDDTDFRYLTAEMESAMHENSPYEPNKEVIFQYLVEVQKRCIAYGRKRGI